MVFVEELLKLFGVVLPTLVENMCVSVCHNLCLCMAGISLYGLDVTASQLELVSDAGMSQAMEHHRWKAFASISFPNSALMCKASADEPKALQQPE